MSGLKKLLIGICSCVMAGTMSLGLAACGEDKEESSKNGGSGISSSTIFDGGSTTPITSSVDSGSTTPITSSVGSSSSADGNSSAIINSSVDSGSTTPITSSVDSSSAAGDKDENLSGTDSTTSTSKPNSSVWDDPIGSNSSWSDSASDSWYDSASDSWYDSTSDSWYDSTSVGGNSSSSGGTHGKIYCESCNQTSSSIQERAEYENKLLCDKCFTQKLCGVYKFSWALVENEEIHVGDVVEGDTVTEDILTVIVRADKGLEFLTMGEPDGVALPWTINSGSFGLNQELMNSVLDEEFPITVSISGSELLYAIKIADYKYYFERVDDVTPTPTCYACAENVGRYHADYLAYVCDNCYDELTNNDSSSSSDSSSNHNSSWEDSAWEENSSAWWDDSSWEENSSAWWDDSSWEESASDWWDDSSWEESTSDWWDDSGDVVLPEEPIYPERTAVYGTYEIVKAEMNGEVGEAEPTYLIIREDNFVEISPYVEGGEGFTGVLYNYDTWFQIEFPMFDPLVKMYAESTETGVNLYMDTPDGCMVMTFVYYSESMPTAKCISCDSTSCTAYENTPCYLCENCYKDCMAVCATCTEKPAEYFYMTIGPVCYDCREEYCNSGGAVEPEGPYTFCVGGCNEDYLMEEMFKVISENPGYYCADCFKNWAGSKELVNCSYCGGYGTWDYIWESEAYGLICSSCYEKMEESGQPGVACQCAKCGDYYSYELNWTENGYLCDNCYYAGEDMEMFQCQGCTDYFPMYEVCWSPEKIPYCKGCYEAYVNGGAYVECCVGGCGGAYNRYDMIQLEDGGWICYNCYNGYGDEVVQVQCECCRIGVEEFVETEYAGYLCYDCYNMISSGIGNVICVICNVNASECWSYEYGFTCYDCYNSSGEEKPDTPAMDFYGTYKAVWIEDQTVENWEREAFSGLTLIIRNDGFSELVDMGVGRNYIYDTWMQIDFTKLSAMEKISADYWDGSMELWIDGDHGRIAYGFEKMSAEYTAPTCNNCGAFENVYCRLDYDYEVPQYYCDECYAASIERCWTCGSEDIYDWYANTGAVCYDCYNALWDQGDGTEYYCCHNCRDDFSVDSGCFTEDGTFYCYGCYEGYINDGALVCSCGLQGTQNVDGMWYCDSCYSAIFGGAGYPDTPEVSEKEEIIEEVASATC